MALEHYLSQKKAAILNTWHHLIMETYPLDTSVVLKREKDRFANPVEYTISQAIEVLYDELLHNMEPDRLSVSLDNIIRIRSVQDFPPSQAIVFVFLLKKAIREVLANDIGKSLDYKNLLEFESRIDELVLLALNIYVKCREKVYEIRLNEIKVQGEQALRLLEISNPAYGRPETKQFPDDEKGMLP